MLKDSPTQDKNTASSFFKKFLKTLPGQFLIIAALLYLVGYLVLYIARNDPERVQVSSMLDDDHVVSEYERLELRDMMDNYFSKTGISLSYHIAPLNPKPHRVGPNTLTIAIETRTNKVRYRLPRGLKPQLKESPEEFIELLEKRFALCLAQDIDRKIPHCLKDTMIAIENKTRGIKPLKLQSN